MNEFLNCITVAQLYTVISNSPKLYSFQTASQKVINSERLFWEAATHTFPQDPPVRSFNVLGALQDSLFGGLLSAGDPKVDMIWMFVDNVSKVFLREKVQFFKDLAFSIRPDDEDRIKYGEGGVQLRVFLVCSNEKNRDAIESDLLARLI